MKNLILLTALLSQFAVFSVQAAPLALGTKGSEIAYSKSKLTAKPGKIELTFKNSASPDSDMPHNVVVLKPGSNVDEIASASVAAGPAKEYIADSPAILAHTALLTGGKSETLSLDLTPGVYPFFCSYPGHAAMMKGTLTVK